MLISKKINAEKPFISSYLEPCGKCSKNFEHFSLFVLNRTLVISATTHKMLVRIANREDPDQTASSEAVWSCSALFVYAFVAGILENLS